MINRFAGKYAFLSNFYICPVEMDERVYASVEHAYQAAKCARLDVRERFTVPGLTAGQAKRLGRNVMLRPDWAIVKDTVMRCLLIQKFKWPDMRMQLLATGDEDLVEGNTWNDRYWGVCGGDGQNRLGKLLMWVRAVCKAEREDATWCLPTQIEVTGGIITVATIRECARQLKAAPQLFPAEESK